MNKLYIIDAINYLFRAYYAIGPMTNASGQSTSAVFGFIRSLIKLIKLVHPEHIVCVFDGPDNKKARKELFTDYKSHRKAAPEDLVSQFEWAYQFCEYMGIPLLCIPGVEADDVMATAAIFAKNHQAKAYLCTSDKDLTQLVNDDIFVMHPHKDYHLVDKVVVEELFGVPPEKILDYLSMVGDSSDNIPGIPGFGPKTAVSLLQEFGSLQELLNHPEKVKGEKKQKALIEFKDQAILSQKLATLNTSVEIPTDEYFYQKKDIDYQKLSQFYRDLNFSTLLRELEESQKTLEPKKISKLNYSAILSLENLDSCLNSFQTVNEISLCVIGSDKPTSLAKLIGISFAIEEGSAYFLPLNQSLDRSIILEKVRAFFQNSKAKLISHDLKLAQHILENEQIVCNHLSFDTQIASYLLQPHLRRHTLDELSLEKLGITKISKEQLLGKGAKSIQVEEVDLEAMKEYACEAADFTLRLKNHLYPLLDKEQLLKVFSEIEMPLIEILESMESHGISIDRQELTTLGREFSANLEKIQDKIFKEVGFTFNLNSPKQLSEVLFDTLGISKPTKTKTAFATDAANLEEIAKKNPIANDILLYRSLEKLRATYVAGLLDCINPRTQKIHCSFNQAVTATGRLSCQDPNLQNIPIKTKEGNKIRACFKPESKGYSFISADYSQIELRLLAHFSKDPDLILAFKEGQDIHAHTASRIYNVPITMITPQMRSSAKTVNFGILYGQGPYGLSQLLDISMKEAAEFIKTYFDRYPKVLGFLESCKDKARQLGFSTTITGRKRPIPEINSKNAQLRAAAERLAVNTPLQGTAADLIKIAMIRVDNEIKKNNLQGKMILQIHDELLFEVPDHEIEIFKKVIKKNMEQVFLLDVPLCVDINIGKNWAEC